MTITTDTNDTTVNPSTAAGAGDGNKGNSSAIDWERKYKGMQRKFDEQRESLVKLEQKLNDSSETNESELATLRAANQAILKKHSEQETLLGATVLERDKFKAESEKATRRSTARSKIADMENPALLKLFDKDRLKEPTDFADDAKYEEYLNGVVEDLGGMTITPTKTSASAGVTPPASPRVRDGGKSKDTLESLSAELEQTRTITNAVERKSKQAEILARMDKVS